MYNEYATAYYHHYGGNNEWYYNYGEAMLARERNRYVGYHDGRENNYEYNNHINNNNHNNNMNSNMANSQKPKWIRDRDRKKCNNKNCLKKFKGKKHGGRRHCRGCGEIFCKKCTGFWVEWSYTSIYKITRSLRSFKNGVRARVNVCEECYNKI